jgi:hypothetical protein
MDVDAEADVDVDVDVDVVVFADAVPEVTPRKRPARATAAATTTGAGDKLAEGSRRDRRGERPRSGAAGSSVLATQNGSRGTLDLSDRCARALRARAATLVRRSERVRLTGQTGSEAGSG